MRHGSHEAPVKPKGYRKARSRMRASRSPVYIPTSTASKEAAAVWLTAK